MSTPTRRVRHPWARTQAGETAVSVLMGATIGLLILSGLIGFYISTNNSSQDQSKSARQEASATETMNRIRRDIQASSNIVTADSKLLVMDRKSKKGAHVRTYYRVVGDDASNGRVERAERKWTGDEAPSSSWPGAGTVTETATKDVDPASSRFTYKNRDTDDLPAPVGNTSKVKLVEIDLAATTPGGVYILASAAAVDSGRGTAEGPVGDAGDPDGPWAVDVFRDLERGDSVAINLIPTAFDGQVSNMPTPSFASSTGLTVTPATELGVGWFTVTASSSAALGQSAAAFEFTVDGQTAAARLYITVTVPFQNPVANADTARVQVTDWISGALPVTVNVLANDICDNGASTGTTVACDSASIAPHISVSATSNIAGVAVSVVNKQVRVQVDEDFDNSTRTFPVTYTLTDSRDGGHATTSTLTVTVGPAAVNDSVNGTSGNLFSVNVFTNDKRVGGNPVPLGTLSGGVVTCPAAQTKCVAFHASDAIAGWQTGVPAGFSYNTSTGVASWTPTYQGLYRFMYTYTENRGGVWLSNSAYVSGTVSPAGYFPPNAVNDTTAVEVSDFINGGVFAYVDVLANDTCRDTTPVGNTVGCKTVGGGHISVSGLGPTPNGVTAIMDTGNRVRISVNEDFGNSARNFTLTYTVSDNRAGGSQATGTITVNVGPAALNDSRDLGVGESVSVNLFANDKRVGGTHVWLGTYNSTTGRVTCPTGTTWCVAFHASDPVSGWRTTLPPSYTWNAATRVLTWTGPAAGLYRFAYTYAEQRSNGVNGVWLQNTGHVSGVVTNQLSITAGAYDFGADGRSHRNLVSFGGGSGNYRIYRSATVDASSNPVSPQLVTTSASSGVVLNAVAPNSRWHYFVYDDRTSGAAANPAVGYRAINTVRALPGDVTLWATGSDKNADKVVNVTGNERPGVNTLAWAPGGDSGAYASVGVIEYSTSTYVGVPILTNRTDLGLKNYTYTNSPSPSYCVGHSHCWERTGVPRGAERAYSAYGANSCNLHPSSPYSTCRSYRYYRTTSPSYTDHTAIGNSLWIGNGTSTSSTWWTGNQAVRVHQLPPQPSATATYNNGSTVGAGAAYRTVQIGNPVGDSCAAADNSTNLLYNCDNRQIQVNWWVEGDDAVADVQGRAGWCDWDVNIELCRGELRRGVVKHGDNSGYTWAPSSNPYGPASGGEVVAANIRSPWHTSNRNVYGFAGPYKATLGALGFDENNWYTATACNPGGCASNHIGTARVYPEKASVSGFDLGVGSQYKAFLNGTVYPRNAGLTDKKSNGSYPDCWSTENGEAACTKRDDRSSAGITVRARGAEKFRLSNSVSTVRPGTYNSYSPPQYQWEFYADDVTVIPSSEGSPIKMKKWANRPVFPAASNTLSAQSYGAYTNLWQSSVTEQKRTVGFGPSIIMGSPFVRHATDSMTSGGAYKWRYASKFRTTSKYRGRDDLVHSIYPEKWVWHVWAGHANTAESLRNQCQNLIGATLCNRITAPTTAENKYLGGWSRVNVSSGAGHAVAPGTTYADGSEFYSTSVFNQPKFPAGHTYAGLPKAEIRTEMIGGTGGTRRYNGNGDKQGAVGYVASKVSPYAGTDLVYGGYSAVRRTGHFKGTGAFHRNNAVMNAEYTWCGTNASSCTNLTVANGIWTAANNSNLVIKMVHPDESGVLAGNPNHDSADNNMTPAERMNGSWLGTR